MATLQTHHKEESPSFYERLRSFKTLDRNLKLLAAVVLAQIIAAAMLILLPTEKFSPISVDSDDKLPLVHYIAICAFILFGFALLMEGMFNVSGRGRAILFFIWALPTGFGIVENSSDIPRALISLVVLITWWWLIGFLPRAFQRRYKFSGWKRYLPWIVLGPLSLWMISTYMGEPGDGTFLERIYLVFFNAIVALIPLAGTDWAELGDTLSRWAATHAPISQNMTALRASIAIISVAGIIFFGSFWFVPWEQRITNVAPNYLWSELVGIGFILFVLWGAKYRGSWVINFPWGGLAVIVVVLFAVMNFAGNRGYGLHAILTFTFLASIFLCVCGRTVKLNWLAPTLLFAVIAGISGTFNVYGFTFFPRDSRPPFFGVVETYFLALVLAGWLALKYRGYGELRRALMDVFVFICSFSYLCMLMLAYNWAAIRSHESPILIAVFLILATTWDIVTSGHVSTDIEDSWFSRRGRILLFFGYMVLLTATFLFMESVQNLNQSEATSWEFLKAVLGPEFGVSFGIQIYGTGIIFSILILRLGNWYFETKPNFANLAPQASKKLPNGLDESVRQAEITAAINRIWGKK
jgi:hypothetical protein